ncbi:hypothetical protein CGLO_11986 [Colletotrichum gloeosporioides Cg-14]|uniref:Uncharacterized protein n=1 Tax=Colletotrichum gloeosporioides (strain Cg-14) TaxID=1237896 RepID=T0K9T4_COLGC|nr:hypothetical protein CGLO_11986 [Colletotrichum gloeosporioides Cg-14]
MDSEVFLEGGRRASPECGRAGVQNVN